MTDFSRGDVFGLRGAQLMNSNGTWTGGVKGATLTSVAISSGSIGDSVDGKVIGIPFKCAVENTATAEAKVCGSGTNTKFYAPKAGSVVGLSVYITPARAAGHATFSPKIGSTAVTGVDVTWGSAATHGGYVTEAKDSKTFAAGKQITVQCKSATATTGTACGMLFIEI